MVYSNHLITEHLKTRFTWDQTLCMSGIQMLNVTWRTIWIPDILDHNQAFSVWFSDHHSNTGSFDNRTQIYYSNTRLDGIQMVTVFHTKAKSRSCFDFNFSFYFGQISHNAAEKSYKTQHNTNFEYFLHLAIVSLKMPCRRQQQIWF